MSLKILKEEVEELMRELMADEPEKPLADASYGMVALSVPKGITNNWGVNVKNPHITIAYFPIVNAYMINKVARVLQKKLENTEPLEIKTMNQDWFGPEKDTRVALVRPTYELFDLKDKIWNTIDSILPGIVDKKYKQYKPHITIGKLGEVSENNNTDCEMVLDTIVIGIKDRETYRITLRKKEEPNTMMIYQGERK